MELVDTHCHIHFNDYALDADQTLADARDQAVNRVICVGTTLEDSQRAIDFASRRDGVWASAGVHPHDAGQFVKDPSAPKKLLDLLSSSQKIVAVGEIGLDYYKNYSRREDQQKTLASQIEASIGLGLPYIFHVREAWEDFWPIFDSYPNLRGVIHSFSAHAEQLEQILQRQLYVGLNGIMTFTSDKLQLEAAKAVPSESLVLETDSPFLTPAPFRNQVCAPKHIRTIAEFLAELRGQSLEEVAAASTNNALNLLGLK